MQIKQEKQLNTKEYIHKFPVDKVYDALKTSPQGLTEKQAKENQKAQGKNLIEEKKKESVFLSFLKNFISLMAVLLWISGIIAFIADMPQLAIAIWSINIINGVFSFGRNTVLEKLRMHLKVCYRHIQGSYVMA